MDKKDELYFFIEKISQNTAFAELAEAYKNLSNSLKENNEVLCRMLLKYPIDSHYLIKNTGISLNRFVCESVVREKGSLLERFPKDFWTDDLILDSLLSPQFPLKEENCNEDLRGVVNEKLSSRSFLEWAIDKNTAAAKLMYFYFRNDFDLCMRVVNKGDGWLNYVGNKRAQLHAVEMSSEAIFGIDQIFISNDVLLYAVKLHGPDVFSRLSKMHLNRSTFLHAAINLNPDLYFLIPEEPINSTEYFVYLDSDAKDQNKVRGKCYRDFFRQKIDVISRQGDLADFLSNYQHGLDIIKCDDDLALYLVGNFSIDFELLNFSQKETLSFINAAIDFYEKNKDSYSMDESLKVRRSIAKNIPRHDKWGCAIENFLESFDRDSRLFLKSSDAEKSKTKDIDFIFVCKLLAALFLAWFLTKLNS